MSNRTEDNDLQQCRARSWCNVPGPTHTGEHDGEADVAKVTATGYRGDFVVHDQGGLIVPEIIVRLAEQIEPSGVLAPLTIHLAVSLPDGVSVNCILTPHEADLLRRHLTQLLQEVGR